MTTKLSGTAVDRLPNDIASCIDKLGSGEFYSRFFQMMKTFTTIDQYMVFEFSPNGDYTSCRLAHNIEHPELGLELASLYLDGAHLEDPLLDQLRSSAIKNPDQPLCKILDKRTLPAVYRRRFFNVPHFESKLSFVVIDPDSHHLFYINFYHKHAGGFTKNQLDKLELNSALIGSLLLKHFRDERKNRGTVNSLLASGLSEREAQICNMILKGHTAKSIGIELALSEATVVTYKKRAYSKLKIQKKSELVRFV